MVAGQLLVYTICGNSNHDHWPDWLMVSLYKLWGLIFQYRRAYQPTDRRGGQRALALLKWRVRRGTRKLERAVDKRQTDQHLMSTFQRLIWHMIWLHNRSTFEGLGDRIWFIYICNTWIYTCISVCVCSKHEEHPGALDP